MVFLEKMFKPKTDAAGNKLEYSKIPDVSEEKSKLMAENFQRAMNVDEIADTVKSLENELSNYEGEELIKQQKIIHDLIKVYHLKGGKNEQEREVKTGHNIYIEVDFDRHFQPNKDPQTGSSLDELAPKGHQQKRSRGAELGDYVGEHGMKVKEYASEKIRANQSASEIDFFNEEQAENIINQPLTAELKRKLADQGYEKTLIDRRRFGHLIRIKKELNPMRFGKDFKLKAFLNKDGSKKTYDEVVQFCLDNNDPSGETTTSREAAGAYAYRLETIKRMTDRLYNDSDVLLKHKTHGPNPDALLREIMVKDGQTGFDKVEEIGGAIKPGEGIKFIINVDNKGDKTIKLKFRNKVYDIDENKVAELSQEYKNKLIQDKVKTYKEQEQSIKAELDEINEKLNSSHGEQTKELEEKAKKLEEKLYDIEKDRQEVEEEL